MTVFTALIVTSYGSGDETNWCACVRRVLGKVWEATGACLHALECASCVRACVSHGNGEL